MKVGKECEINKLVIPILLQLKLNFLREILKDSNGRYWELAHKLLTHHTHCKSEKLCVMGQVRKHCLNLSHQHKTKHLIKIYIYGVWNKWGK